MTPLEAAALMHRAAVRIEELVATYFPNPGVVQDVFDLSAELKAAAVELEHAGIVDAIKPVAGTGDTPAPLLTDAPKETV